MARARRQERTSGGGRKGDRDNDRDNERAERGGRGGRGGGRRSDTGQITMILVIGVALLVVTGIGLWIWYASLEAQKAEIATLDDAYKTWLIDNADSFKAKAASIATNLKPIYEDVPTEKQTPELVAALSQKYGPTMNSTGAIYAWCKKSWGIKGTNYSPMISPNNATEFLMAPVQFSQLGESHNLMNINGEPTMSGSLSFYYDRSDNVAKAILNLNLAPPTPKASGEDAPKSVSPTSFTLWFLMTEPDGVAKKALYQKMHPTTTPQ